jgi:hypothetical protein
LQWQLHCRFVEFAIKHELRALHCRPIRHR